MRKALSMAVLVILLGSLVIWEAPVAQASVTTEYKEIQGPCRNTATSSSSVVVTFDSIPINGNTMIMVIGAVGTASQRTVSSISQTGVTWTLQRRAGQAVSPYEDVEIWTGVVGAGASVTCTVTLSGSAGGVCANGWEFSGLNPDDEQYGANPSDSTSPVSTGTTGSATVQARELIVGAVCSRSSSPTISNPTNGFTLYDGVTFGTNYAVAGLMYNATSTGTFESSVDVSGSTMTSCAVILTLPITEVATAYTLTLSSMYEDGTTLSSLSVGVHDALGDTSLTIYSTPKTYYFSSPVQTLTWTAGSFTRVLHPTHNDTYTILQPQGGATVAVYQFNIKDYSDILTDPSYIEYWRVVGGSDYLVGDMEIVDTLNGVPLIWVYSATYEVKIRTTGATYSQGYILAGDDYDINVLLKELSFTASAMASYKYVTMEAVRPSATQIVTSWNNTLTPTYDIDSGTIYIYYRNGTEATHSAIASQAGSFTWNSAVNVTDYRVYIDISHDYLGAVHYEKVLAGANAEATDFPSLDVFGGGTTTFNQEALAVASMFIVGGAVSFASIPLGALSLVALGGFYSYSGVVPLSSDVLWTIIGLVGLIFLASRRGG